MHGAAEKITMQQNIKDVTKSLAVLLSVMQGSSNSGPTPTLIIDQLAPTFTYTN